MLGAMQNEEATRHLRTLVVLTLVLELLGALAGLAALGLDGFHTLLEILRSALGLLLEILGSAR